MAIQVGDRAIVYLVGHRLRGLRFFGSQLLAHPVGPGAEAVVGNVEDVGAVLRCLLGPMQGRIIEMTWEDMSHM